MIPFLEGTAAAMCMVSPGCGKLYTYLAVLLAGLPCSNIRAAIHILVLPLPLKLVPGKLPLVHGTIRQPHDTLSTAFALGIAPSIASPLGHKVQTHPLPPVIAVLPKVGVAICIYGLGSVIVSLVCAIKPPCNTSVR